MIYLFYVYDYLWPLKKYDPKWGFPAIGLPLVIIHFNGIFHYQPSSYGGTPFMETIGNLHMMILVTIGNHWENNWKTIGNHWKPPLVTHG